ncbi:3-hydroxy-9,10-secoandrosta-1,3,5(10)-triene-9,17-dione monooxygenase [Sphingomonas laterariae]|uniref:3-hydroxy-9,10-secoandrosta-1,3,5(10)-triene-9,17-dione monooxygenase n=1 Tax=Edaphosphingomonas laterariae TaxID=861865 RepID=A0A239J608_9SPHN|nr:flavin-dependent monooxygenase [Sphingomonas laterariae]SNT00918.1 3-hydroxy-9,10-secoandrosta-1,3,5(10)-triene-9,17-dione monooxygenase [Sphingomonas laterariae]
MHGSSALSSQETAELLARAGAMVPTLRARAAQCEAEGKVPDETIRDFQEAGFFRILQPARWGGFEMDPEAFYAAQMKLAEGCMSSAWVLGVVAVHNWQLALFDPQAQADVWAEDSSTLIASSYMPRAKVVPVDGGYRISGRWGFSSGVDHCAWVFLGGLVPDPEGGAPDYRTFLVPRADFTVDRIWDTLGLRGTGSQDVVVEDAFVPAYRSHRSKDGFAATSPGLKLNDAPLFKLPFGQIFVRAVSSSAIGALQGALDQFRDYAAGRVSSNDFSRTADDPDAQVIVAETAAAIDEMKLTLNRNFAALMAGARAGEVPALDQRLLFRFQSAQVLDRCAQLITRLFYSCGAQGVYRTSPLARTFVDIHTGRTHVANNPLKVGRNVGGVMLGNANSDTFV